MIFKLGDMVEVTDKSAVGWMIGLRGTIKGSWPYQCSRHGAVYDVDFSGSSMMVCACVLKLIPPDDDGRQVVDWDWKELTRKQTMPAETG